MASLSIVWMTDNIDRLNIFSYTYLMKTVKARTFIMKDILIPHLFIMFHSFKKKSQKAYVFLFISGCILPLLLPSLWNCQPAH